MKAEHFKIKFQTYLQDIVREELAYESDVFNTTVQKYIQKVAVSVGYPVSYAQGEYSLSFLKSIKFQPCIDGQTLVDRLLQYLELIQAFIPNPCFVLVLPHMYFSCDEIKSFYEIAGYRKHKILIIENKVFPTISGEEYYIIDEQMCELRVDFCDEIY